MKPRPVGEAQEPGYPTRRDVLAGAASFVLVGITGCGDALRGPNPTRPIVAPVFAHGAGRGASGCVVMVPPVFLSEEEGMQILREELAKHKIDLKKGGALKGVRVASRHATYDRVEKKDGSVDYELRIVEGDATPLEPDGQDPGAKIAVEFVSRSDYQELGGLMSDMSVQDYEFKKVAEDLTNLVSTQGESDVYFGVFYDPVAGASADEFAKARENADWETALQKYREQGKEASAKLLRQQAADFVAWLKQRKVSS